MDILEKQKDFFKSGETLNINFRIKNLKLLKESILKNIDELVIAFKEDYNKCEFDVYSTEVGLVIKEINYFIRHLKRLSHSKKVGTSLINFPSLGVVVNEPYGCVLIISPWNYPFQLTIMPLIGSIAAGNTSYLKCSRNTKNVTEIIKKILSIFNEEYIYVMDNSSENVEQLFDKRFDYIFYTGSTSIAKKLMEKQAKYLTPMTLELGGKSPCIIDIDANIKTSVKRLIWGKYLNAGQTCVAPDYLLVHKDVKRDVMKYILEYIDLFYYNNMELSEDFPSIINEKRLNRLLELIKNKEIVFGGRINKGKTLEPTVIDDVSFDDLIMQEEIFGPILPIIEFENIDDVVNHINEGEKPLSLYYFGKKNKNKIMNIISFGGGCINDTIMHLTEEKLPFGGIGFSGMGSYHGIKSFETFTHKKSILKKNAKLELNLKYPPYSKKKLKLTKLYFKIKNRRG